MEIVAVCPGCDRPRAVKTNDKICTHWEKDRPRRFGFGPCSGSGVFTRFWPAATRGGRSVREEPADTGR